MFALVFKNFSVFFPIEGDYGVDVIMNCGLLGWFLDMRIACLCMRGYFGMLIRYPPKKNLFFYFSIYFLLY